MSNKTLTLGQAAAWCGGQIAPELEERPFFGANFDSRLIRPGELFAALPGARDGHDFAASALERGAAAVLASRPVDGPAIYVEDTSHALRDIARGYRESLPCRCVGITGSVGKTTTKEMIAAVLRTALRTQWTEKNYNNEIGLPVSVLRLKPDCEAAVLEMGMNHFGELSVLTRIAQPDLAVITNIGTMHIENLGSREGILQAKLEILEGLRPGGRVIFNGDDALLRPLAARYHAVCFGLSEGCNVRASRVCESAEGSKFTVHAFGKSFEAALSVPGLHNVLDALAAAAVGLLLGLSPEQIAEGLRSYAPLRQRVSHAAGMTIIDDCYNAGPESMRASAAVLLARQRRRRAAASPCSAGMPGAGRFCAGAPCRGRPRGCKGGGRLAAGLRPLQRILCAGCARGQALPGRRPLPRTMRSSLRWRRPAAQETRCCSRAATACIWSRCLHAF